MAKSYQIRSKSKRRVKGSGTIFPHPTKGWVGRVIVGRKPNGKPLYAERSAQTVAELQVKLAAAGPPTAATTVAEWCKRWLGETDVRPSTKHNQRNAVTNRIVPVLGHLPVAALTPGQVERAVTTWIARGMKASTARGTLAILQTALEQARRAGLRADNPAELARKPKTQPKAIDPFTPAEMGAVFAHCAASAHLHPVAAIAALGCRPGEALGLDVGDYDAKRRTVRIERTMHAHGRRLGPVKSRHSRRTLDVPDDAAKLFEEAIGDREEGPLFLSSQGRRAVLPVVHKAWITACKRLGLRYRNLHQLRHSWASLAIAAGAPVADVARHLGDTVATVVRVYLHATGSDMRAVGNLVLGGVKPPTASRAKPSPSPKRRGS
jgi:integrase